MRELLLLEINGINFPKTVPAIIHFISEHPLTILNIDQHTTHASFSLSLLLEPTTKTISPFLEKLTILAQKLNCSIRKTVIDPKALPETPPPPTAFTITLLARALSSKQLNDIIHLIEQHNLKLQRINPLSHHSSYLIKSSSTTKITSLELCVSGQPRKLNLLRKTFLDLAQSTGIDIAFQKECAYRRYRRLVVFDMDSTLIETEVIDELAEAAGVGEQVSTITERAMRGEIDFNDSFKQRVALLRGLSTDVLSNIADRLPITPGAEHLLKHLKMLGLKTAIISGGFQYFGDYLQKRLGFDYVFANHLDTKEGIVTGEVHEPIINGERKAELLEQIAQQEGIALEQSIAVGDGANDLPMLSKAGMGIAFRAKPIVKAQAEHSISTFGLDAILYLMGFSDTELDFGRSNIHILR